MKKVLLTLSLFSILGMQNAVTAQNESAGSRFVSDKKGSLIGFSGNLHDFNESPQFKNPMDIGLSLFYWKGITKKLDYSVRLNGLYSTYIKGFPANSYHNIYPELEGALHLRAMNDDKIINPFLTAGVGLGYYNSNLNDKAIVPYAPVGVGIQINLFSEAYIFLQANYRFSFSEHMTNNTFYSLGVAQTINYGTPKPEPIPPAPIDTDGDGVADKDDKCPNVAGLTHLGGCPDSDGDGIIDSEDECPKVAGVSKYKGCPIPDTDGDGVNDEEDACPEEAGVKKYKGCPIPDTDNDGVNDEMDRCPNVAGPASNNGCPEVKEEVKKRLSFAATAIQFETGKAVITKKSYGILDEVVAIMNEYTDYKMDINGHTDNTGKADRNLILSEERAASVKQYLIEKGIDASRLSSKGYGQENPVADNKTADGRSKNRRVELDLKLK